MPLAVGRFVHLVDVDVTQAIERVLAVVKNFDPTLSDVTFEVAVHERALEEHAVSRTGAYRTVEKVG